MSELLRRDAIEKCKTYVKTRLVYTGRVANATRLAKPFLIFQGFVAEHREWWLTEFAYKHKGTAAGTLAPTYPMFRDHVLLVALREVNKGLDKDVTRYMYRKLPRMGGTIPPRAIVGWEVA